MSDPMDLFGRALLDHLHNRSRGPFHVIVGDVEESLDLGFFFAEVPEDFELKPLEAARGRILDVGCGAGRILKFLQQRGHDAHGSDIAPGAVQACVERGVRNVWVGSHADEDQHGIYNTVLLLNRVLATAGSLEGIVGLLRRCGSWTGPEGIVIFDSLEIRPELANDGPGVLKMLLRFKYDGAVSEEWPYVHIGSEVAERLVREAGWEVMGVSRSRDRYAMTCRKRGLGRECDG